MATRKVNLNIKTYETKQLVGLYLALTVAYMLLPEPMWALRKLLSPALALLLFVICIDVIISLAKPKA